MDFDVEDLSEMFSFLDGLREFGSTNMFGAGVDLAEEYAISRKEGRAVLSAWMKTFGTSESADERAQMALEAA